MFYNPGSCSWGKESHLFSCLRLLRLCSSAALQLCSSAALLFPSALDFSVILSGRLAQERLCLFHFLTEGILGKYSTHLNNSLNAGGTMVRFRVLVLVP